jgi:hypothetical protein
MWLTQIGSGMNGLFADWGLVIEERRYAKHASGEMLTLYKALRLEFPTWLDGDIYKALVMRRIGCNAVEAMNTLHHAYESYAHWPADRSLTLCDVIHYLAVNEFLAAHTGEKGTRTAMGQIVASQIPHTLCVARGESHVM